jgi:cytokinin dehydrogenase
MDKSRSEYVVGCLREVLDEFAGALVFDEPSRLAAADDFGHIVHRTPSAVLRPRSAEDIIKLVRLANEHDFPVAVRGVGHSALGHSQVQDGVVIDSSTLNQIHAITHDRVVVDAGVLWSDLLRATLLQGLTPRVFPGFIELTVGGTLSIGGVGGATFRYGMQVDNVLALEVITGTGQPMTCSPTEHPELFRAALGGLGQFAVITRATIRLQPAKTMARSYQLSYTELERCLAAMKRIATDERFDFQRAQVFPNPKGGFLYVLLAASYFTAPDLPDDGALLADLDLDDPASTVIADDNYFDWVNRLAAVIDIFKEKGVWNLPHPWFDVFLPATKAQGFIQDALASVPVAELSPPAFVLIYPLKQERLSRSSIAVPNEPSIFLFSILRTAKPGQADVERMLDENRRFYEKASTCGGKVYAATAIRFKASDWVAHFGAIWPGLAQAKAEFDPQNVLTPGPGIFVR